MDDATDGTACRTIPMGRRSVTGRLPVRGRMVPFESTLERDLLVLFDADRSVTRVLEQPFRIPYVSLDGRRTSYVPDYQADRRDGAGILAEVKYHQELHERRLAFAPRFRAAAAFARSRNMRFRIFTERRIRTPYLANLKFLKRYPSAPNCDDPTEEHLVATLEGLGAATASALVEAAYACQDNRARAIPALWGLVGAGRVSTRLTVPLTMASTLRVADGRGTAWPGPHSLALPLGEARWRRAGQAPPDRMRLLAHDQDQDQDQAPEPEGLVDHGGARP